MVTLALPTIFNKNTKPDRSSSRLICTTIYFSLQCSSYNKPCIDARVQSPHRCTRHVAHRSRVFSCFADWTFTSRYRRFSHCFRCSIAASTYKQKQNGENAVTHNARSKLTLKSNAINDYKKVISSPWSEKRKIIVYHISTFFSYKALFSEWKSLFFLIWTVFFRHF